MSHNNKSDLHHASSSRIGVLVFFTTAIGAEDDRVEMWQVGELLGGIVSLGRGCIRAVRLFDPDPVCSNLPSQTSCLVNSVGWIVWDAAVRLNVSQTLVSFQSRIS
jgi:hypothetical protein